MVLDEGIGLVAKVRDRTIPVLRDESQGMTARFRKRRNSATEEVDFLAPEKTPFLRGTFLPGSTVGRNGKDNNQNLFLSF